jgi:KaiC/GvpD/RAD55 family RecA-like ATPase
MINNYLLALIDKDTSEEVRQYLLYIPPTMIREGYEQSKLFAAIQKEPSKVLELIDISDVSYSDVLDVLESEDYKVWCAVDDRAKVANIIADFNEWKKLEVSKYVQQFEKSLLTGKIEINHAISHLHDKVAKLPTLDEDDSFLSGLDEFANIVYRRMDTGVSGLIQLPFTKLNNDLNGGFRRKSLVVLNATTGGGKTMLAQNLVRFWSKLGMNILYVSTEMSKEHLVSRWIRQEGYEKGKIITEDMILRPQHKSDVDAITSLVYGMEDYKIHFAMKKTDIEDIEFAMRKRNYDIVVIDHMHQITGVDDFDKLEVVLKRLDRWADDKDSLVLLLAQSRKEDSYGNSKSRVHLGQIKGSAKLIDIASFVGALYEDEDKDCSIIKVLKDRFNGIKNREYPINFIPEGCTYKEII